MMRSTLFACVALAILIRGSVAGGRGDEQSSLPVAPKASPPPTAVLNAQTTPPRASGEDIGRRPSDIDVLDGIVNGMRSSESFIRQRKTYEETSPIQQKILNDLSSLIDQRTGQGGSGPSKQTTRQSPAKRSGEAPSKGLPGESSAKQRSSDTGLETPANRADLVNEVWGQLPKELQRQVQSPLHEQFLPGFEKLISEYYKRLAEDTRQ